MPWPINSLLNHFKSHWTRIQKPLKTNLKLREKLKHRKNQWHQCPSHVMGAVDATECNEVNRLCFAKTEQPLLCDLNTRICVPSRILDLIWFQMLLKKLLMKGKEHATLTCSQLLSKCSVAQQHTMLIIELCPHEDDNILSSFSIDTLPLRFWAASGIPSTVAVHIADQTQQKRSVQCHSSMNCICTPHDRSPEQIKALKREMISACKRTLTRACNWQPTKALFK